MASSSRSSRSSVPELFHPQGSFKFLKRKFGSTERSFRAAWCDNYPWLHYDKANDSAFCHLCMRAVSEGKLLASTKRDPAFISNGCTYWKEATSAFNFALIMCHSSTLAGSTELFYSDLYTVLKSQKCHQIQSQSINFSKFSWGGHAPRPP